MSNHVFEELRVILTGDMVSGIIHELEESNCLNIVEQAHLGALVTAQGLLDLARRFPRVIVTCVAGNHGRVREKKYYKHRQTVSWDYIFYETLALLLKNQNNITFQIPLCNWAGVEIQGFNFFVNHGDSIKSWGGIPFYGLNREASKWAEINASNNKFFQYFLTSHFHTRALLQSAVGEKIMNGSLKGGCEYAIGQTLYSPPSQLLFGVHKRHGKTWELPINPARTSNIQVRYKYDRTKDLSSQIEI
jgi:hypothetical protein